ncbi:MAG: hypothetical protein WBM07_14630 [Chitinivibrionales bacterium]
MPARFIIALCRFSAITMCVSIIGAILYNGFHPHSHPGIVTIVLIFLSVALAIVLIRLPLKLTITKRTVFFLAATAFALRLFAIVSINNAQVSDFKIFDELARALHHGNGFSYTDSAGLSEAALFLNKCDGHGPVHTAFRLPGFPVILALLYSITGDHAFFGKILNAILCVMIGFVLFLLVKTIDKTAAMIAMAFWLFYPGTIIASNLLCTEISFIFFAISAAALVNYIPRSGVNSGLLLSFMAGLCVSLAALIRPATQFMICAFCVLPFIRAPLKFRPLLVIVFAAGLAGPLVAWGMRNVKTFGVFEMQTSEIGFNCFCMTQQLLENEKDPKLDSLKKIMVTSRNEFTIDRAGKAIGMTRYRLALRKWWKLPRVFILNQMRCWRDDCDLINYCKEGLPDGQQVFLCSIFAFLIRIMYLSLIVLALIGAIRLPWRAFISQPGLMFLMLYFISSALLIMLFEVIARHHFPLLIMLCILASFFRYNKNQTT